MSVNTRDRNYTVFDGFASVNECLSDEEPSGEKSRNNVFGERDYDDDKRLVSKFI